jgi:hypothetical protein
LQGGIKVDDSKSFNQDEIKHLEFIQNAISRMASNSFQMKGWAITIFSALLALFAASNGKLTIYLFVAVIPTILFWALDTYYLQQERKFRGVYNDVVGITPALSRQEVPLFAMPLTNYTGGNYSYWKVLFSKTICPLYLLMITGAAIGGFVIDVIKCG